MLKNELAKASYHDVSERTVRRMLKRLGFRWKQPKYVLGRPERPTTKGKGEAIRRVKEVLEEAGRFGSARR